GHRIELIGIVEESEMADAWVVRDRQQRVSDQHERQPSPPVTQIPLKKIKELFAAFVLVDPADIDGEGHADVVFLAESPWLRGLRYVGADAHDNTGHFLVAGDSLNHRALFVRVVHERANPAEQRRENGYADRRIAFGGRDENRPRSSGA